MNILKVFTKEREIGNIGEKMTCRYLKRRGYKILHRNYVCDGHEIDIIAENKEFICFTEVKTRTVKENQSWESRPADAVDREKQKNIINASRLFASINAGRGKMFRFDVAEVYLHKNKRLKEINYMESAFSPDRTFGRGGFKKG